jgi:hypothetical protein
MSTTTVFGDLLLCMTLLLCCLHRSDRYCRLEQPGIDKVMGTSASGQTSTVRKPGLYLEGIWQHELLKARQGQARRVF